MSLNSSPNAPLHKDGTGPAGPLAWAATALAGLVLVYYILNAIFANKRLPGPLFQIPFVGDTLGLAVGDPAKFLFERFKRYGRIFRLRMIGFEACIIADPDVLRPILSDQGAYFDVPAPTFKALMGPYSINSLKHVHGPWRKAMMAAVNGKNLKEKAPRLLAVMQRSVDEWAAAGRVDLYAECRRLGIDVGVDVMAGFELDGRVDLDWFKGQVLVFLQGLYGLPIKLPGTKLSRALAAKERMLDALMPVLEKEHREFEQEWEASGRNGAVLSSKYCEPGETVTVGQAEMMGFRMAGFEAIRDTGMTVLHSVVATVDTTRAALFHTLGLLAISPRVQEEIYKEQQKVIAEHGPEVTFEATMAMTYLDATFKECMRLLPASGGGIRMLTADLRAGDWTIPAGSHAWYHPLLLALLDPVLWDGDTSPDVPPHMDWRNNLEQAFRPERWLSEETRPRFHYVFGSGSRQCVGINLVHLEVKQLLALLLRKFRLVPEVPDMLKRCERYFPFLMPSKGTDGLKLVAREQPLA